MADVGARSALADRLGISLTRLRPDRLDQLLLQPAGLTEASLKSLFGFEETTIKPLTASILPEPTLLIWQKEHLRADWQAQDDAARTEEDTPVPLVDPDLVTAADLRSPNPGNPAFDLWQARRDDVAAHAAELDRLRKGQKTQQAGFDKIVAALGPIPELLALAEQRRQGRAIDDRLRAKRLSLAAFLRLIRVRELAAANSVLDSEWLDVYAILVQVRKIGLFATWRRPGAAERPDPRPGRVPAARSLGSANAERRAAGPVRLARHNTSPPGMATDSRGARAAGTHLGRGTAGGR